jgi:mRNA interferase HicA
MKREGFLQHLRKNRCYLKREGAAHSLWINSANGVVQAVPRHSELSDGLCRKICKELRIPFVR